MLTFYQLTLRSHTKKHSPIYHLHVTYTAPQTGKTWEDKEVTGHFTEWFNMHGYIDKPALKKWLAKNIEVVGLAAPESLQAGEKKIEDIAAETIVVGGGDDQVSTGATGADVGGTTQTPGKRGRKKKA
jgi:hypothetical protein